jgi:hypothetical protein
MMTAISASMQEREWQSSDVGRGSKLPLEWGEEEGCFKVWGVEVFAEGICFKVWGVEVFAEGRDGICTLSSAFGRRGS